MVAARLSHTIFDLVTCWNSLQTWFNSQQCFYENGYSYASQDQDTRGSKMFANFMKKFCGQQEKVPPWRKDTALLTHTRTVRLSLSRGWYRTFINLLLMQSISDCFFNSQFITHWLLVSSSMQCLRGLLILWLFNHGGQRKPPVQ